jgi:glycosyltransferase involved in cell wall biosynthesis
VSHPTTTVAPIRSAGQSPDPPAPAAEPLVSVVIASVNGLPCLAECLEALLRQEGGVPFEVLVVDRCGAATRAEVCRRFPDPPVRLIAADGRPSIPALRAIGIRQARGQMVAVTEDHCLAPPRWVETIWRAHQAGRRIVGGAVANGATRRLVDWAVFFCEYAGSMPPLPAGRVADTPGNNTAYDRELLGRLAPEIGAEIWESFLHRRLRELGVQFYLDAGMEICHKKEFGYRYFLSQRYHYSRSFAGMRLAEAPPWKRVIYAASTGLLPGVLLARIGRAVWRKGRRGTFLLTLPVLVTFLITWAWGEAVGALCGPGDSLARVE